MDDPNVWVSVIIDYTSQLCIYIITYKDSSNTENSINYA